LKKKLEEEIEVQKINNAKINPFPSPPNLNFQTITQKSAAIENKKNLSNRYKNPIILRDGCSLTVVLMDPRISLTARLGDLWISLESVASNVDRETTCIVLQTSKCVVHDDTTLLKNLIESKAMPLFLEMIHRGNVRYSIINHEKYKMKNCHQFYTPSRAFMNIEYWGPSEFEPQDNDLVLMIQNDSILCHNLDPGLWRDVAYVGGPWPPEANLHNNPVPEDGTCKALPRFWSQWTEPILQQKFHEKWKAGNITGYKPPAANPVKLSLPLDTVNVESITFPSELLCKDLNGPLGNGGFSLRSRTWMRRAIATCPHVHYSGLAVNPKCQVFENIPEDLYFATVLRAISAPFPTAFEASLLAVEMMFATTTMEYYGPNNLDKEIFYAQKRWGNMFKMNNQTIMETSTKYKRMREAGIIVPIGIHKVWWYHDFFHLLGDHFRSNCPFFEWMLIGRGWNCPI